MKKIIFSILALLIASSILCQEKIDYKNEKDAIKAVIESEAISHYDRDWEKQSKSFLQDESFIGLASSKVAYIYAIGWEEANRIYEGIYERNPTPSAYKIQNTNYKIKVYKESAWAVYDQIIRNSQDELLRKYICVRFLEKVNGDWKIVYISYVNTTSYDESEVQ